MPEAQPVCGGGAMEDPRGIADSWALGIDLGGTALKAGLVSSAGTVRHTVVMPSKACLGPAAAMEQVRGAAEVLRREARDGGIEVLRAGVGCPGTIDAEGTLGGALPNLPGFAGVAIVPLLQQAVGLPVTVDNDANLMACAEARVGAGRGFDAVLGVTIGTGIGGGIVIAGSVYRGAGGAGELGHMRVVAGGRPCPCGGRGCLEQYASGPALGRLYQARTGEKLDAADVLRRWRDGETAAKGCVHLWGRFLARGLAVAMTILHPECLVLGGGVMEAGGELVALLEHQVRRQCLGTIAESCVMRAARLGVNAGMVGAGLAALASGGVALRIDPR